jgi:hypothetical protein
LRFTLIPFWQGIALSVRLMGKVGAQEPAMRELRDEAAKVLGLSKGR